ncbi:alpha-2-macroglobulin family protein [Thiofilum flexile]|uniref:alpha-2-macroglobulin family protein n=1 Tax=Thiofilum flexile TaxID=125627 RepID=UPI00035EAC78|nr:MG2 domain-containing protein [Thiofilum flexile]
MSSRKILSIILILGLWLIATPNYAEPKTPLDNHTVLTELVLMDLTEQTINDKPVLVLTYSQPLYEYQEHTDFITTTSNGVQVKGTWHIDRDPRRLYFDNINPNTNYRVQIRPGLKSADNHLVQRLPIDISIQTKVLEPQFDFSMRASILPTRLTAGLSIRSINVPELDLEFLQVTPQHLPSVLEQLNLDEGFNVHDLSAIRQFTRSVHSMRFLTHSQPNMVTENIIPVENINTLQAQGVYFVVMRQPGTFDEQAYRVTYFLVSDLALHVRRYAQQIEVFAHTLTTGQIVKDLTVQLYGADKQVLSQRTDATGRAHFDNPPEGAFLVTAIRENDLAFIDLRDPALQLPKNVTMGRYDQAVDIFFYSSHRLFRPKDIVELMFLVRDRDGLPINAQEAYLKLKRPDQKVIYEQKLNAQEDNLGLFKDSFELPSDAPTGIWSIEVRLKETDPEPLNRFNFSVEYYTPEWLKLQLSGSTQEASNSKKIILALQGETFKNRLASGYPVKLLQTTQLNRQPFNTDFYFGDPRDSKHLPAQAESNLTLNRTGGGFWEVDMSQVQLNTPLQFNFTAQLSEPTGYKVEQHLQQSYWPATALIGIKPLFKENALEANTTVRFELAKWDKKGKQVSAQKVAVTLLKSEQHYSWSYTPEMGWKKTANEQLIPIRQQTVSLAENEVTTVEFKVGSGEYWLEVEDSITRLKAAYRFVADWRWQNVNAAVQPYDVKMSLDKPSYRVGEVARVHIIPPSAGEAILTVEGDELLWFKQVHIPAQGATFNIPIHSNWRRHDLYINTLLLIPADKAQGTPPNRALGIIHLPLDRSERELKLTIAAPNKILPEQAVTFTVKAENLKDSSALVFLSAINSQLMSAVNSSEINPANYYFSAKRYGVEQYDSYAKILSSDISKFFTPPLSNQSPVIVKPQQRFNQPTIQPLMSSLVNFNAQGEANIKLTMPSESGTLTLMAVALGEQQLGAVSQPLTVQAPVEMTSMAPRFLAAEDNTKLSVTLENKSEQSQTVNLRIEANEFLHLATSTNHEYILEKGITKSINLPIKASRRFGQGMIELVLEGKGFTIHRKLNILVRAAYPRLQRSRLYTISSEDSAVTLDKTIIQNLQTDSLRARLTLSSIPELSVRAALDDLLAYPYISLESIISKNYPYLFLSPAWATNLGLVPLSLTSREISVRNALVQLSSLQLANGGFAAWSGKMQADPWLSAYAADFLLDAREQGFAVPHYLLNGVLDYLEALLSLGVVNIENKGIDNPDHLAFAIKAYGSYVLSRVNRVSLGNLRTWYDQDSKKALSGLPLVQMGLALYQRTDSKRSREAFERALAFKRDETLQLGDYGSPIRDQAWLLALLLHYRHDIPDLEGRLKELNRQIYMRNYYTTQEQWAFFQLGLQLNITQSFPTWGAQLLLQSRALSVNQKGAYRLDISERELNAGVAVKADPNSTVHATLEVQGYPQPPLAEKKDFFQIQRALFDSQGNTKSLNSLRVGDLIIVHLQVSANEDVAQALVMDLLPGGWVLDRRSLRHLPELGTLILDGMSKPISELLETSPLLTEQLANDRYWAVLPVNKKSPHHLFYLARIVSQGAFRQPPSMVTDMNYPERLGIGAGAERFIIREE